MAQSYHTDETIRKSFQKFFLYKIYIFVKLHRIFNKNKNTERQEGTEAKMSKST